jgi:hypothetical protein
VAEAVEGVNNGEETETVQLLTDYMPVDVTLKRTENNQVFELVQQCGLDECIASKFSPALW